MPTPERMPVMADATICCRPGRPHASVQIKFPRTCRPPSRPSGGRRIPPPQQQAKFPLNRQPARPKKPPAPSVSRRAAPAGGRLIPSEPEHPRSRGAGRRRGSPVVNSPAPFTGRGAPRMAKRAGPTHRACRLDRHRPRVRPFRRSRRHCAKLPMPRITYYLAIPFVHGENSTLTAGTPVECPHSASAISRARQWRGTAPVRSPSREPDTPISENSTMLSCSPRWGRCRRTCRSYRAWCGFWGLGGFAFLSVFTGKHKYVPNRHARKFIGAKGGALAEEFEGRPGSGGSKLREKGASGSGEPEGRAGI